MKRAEILSNLEKRIMRLGTPYPCVLYCCLMYHHFDESVTFTVRSVVSLETSVFLFNQRELMQLISSRSSLSIFAKEKATPFPVVSRE